MNILGIHSFLSESAVFLALTNHLAYKTNLTIIKTPPALLDGGNLLLCITAKGLALHFTGKGVPNPIMVDFMEGANAHRRLFGGGKNQLIAKAVGLKGSYRPYVLDVTAGLGQDGFVLATLGCKVKLLERVPVIFELLNDGLLRAEKNAQADLQTIVSRMSAICQDSLTYLSTSESAIASIPDVIYVDPMFPEREKSALVKKNMAVFQSLVDGDIDAGELLALALTKAKYRVVIKRPRKALSIAEQFPEKKLPKASLVLEGKSSRYDIYPIAKMPDS
ncbi:MAG: 16S rRNA (guanine1516-N2)-methyltransferase [Pseudohongiellaceae bacterium]|jgi:16S rRNA (guanine1516-N2)-methyltransferase